MNNDDIQMLSDAIWEADYGQVRKMQAEHGEAKFNAMVQALAPTTRRQLVELRLMVHEQNCERNHNALTFVFGVALVVALLKYLLTF